MADAHVIICTLLSWSPDTKPACMSNKPLVQTFIVCECMKLRTLVVPGELLLRRFGDEIRSVIVPASVSNTEAKFKHSYKVETVAT